jgi:P4 family phage/plasmid primase-like protien
VSALLEQLEAAAAEGLAPNLHRFLAFLGWTEGEVFELQALHVPADKSAGRWKDAPGMAAHGASLAVIERLAAQGDALKAQGVYAIFNRIDPGVQHRRGPDAWREVPKGEGTSDRDVTQRRALYIDLDPQRTRGISASDDELLAAGRRAEQARDLLARILPPEAIGVGRSGNGCALFVALEPTRPEGDIERVCKAVLVALAGLLDDAAVKVDTSVSEPKRLCFLPGTVKRKGANSSERPHRRAAFIGPATPRRLTLDELRELVMVLRDQLPEDRRGDVDKELAGPPSKGAPRSAPQRTARASSPGEGACDVVNRDLPVQDVLARLGLLDGDRPICPGCREADSGVAIVGNGLKCSHNRCAQKGYSKGFRTVVDLVMEAQGLDARGALAWVRAEFPGVLPPGGSPDMREAFRKAKASKQRPPGTEGGPMPEHEHDQEGEKQAPASPDPWRYHTSDLGNGERFAAQHGRDLRHCPRWGKWLVWDGFRWAEDDRNWVRARAKVTALSIYQEGRLLRDDDERGQARRKALAAWAAKSEGRDRCEAMVAMAQSEPGISIVPRELDRDPWLLNVENGTLDLRTGKLRPHRREDLITKLAPVTYDPEAEAPTFQAFLDAITNHDIELQGFLQRFFGYALTGEIREHVLVMAYGTGSNGKSTLLKAFLDLLGDYAYQAPADLIMAKKGETHPTDQAGLFGRRLAVCMETPEGRSMDEARMKALTGGDLITARRMREDFWTFAPTHKLILATNHKPNIRTTDHGTWRRQKLVPFTVQIPSEKQDKTLPAKLTAEASGLLRWAVEGCLAWQQVGLGEPAAVKAATDGWRQESDPVGAFLTEKCELGEGFDVKAAELYAAYEQFARNSDEDPMSKQAFGRRLTERGLVSSRTKSERTWRGLRLRVTVTDGDSYFRDDYANTDSPSAEPETNGHHPSSVTPPPVSGVTSGAAETPDGYSVDPDGLEVIGA